MFNFGNHPDVCVHLGDTLITRVHLGDTQIYTCGCIPTNTTEEYFDDVQLLCNFDGNFNDCSAYRRPLGRNWRLINGNGDYPYVEPALSFDTYHAPPQNSPFTGTSGSLYFGTRGHNWVTLAANLVPEFTIEARAYRIADANAYNSPHLGFFHLSVTGPTDQDGYGNSAHRYPQYGVSVYVENGVWRLGTLQSYHAGSTLAPLNTWQHIMVHGRPRGDLLGTFDATLYVDGVESGTVQYYAYNGLYSTLEGALRHLYLGCAFTGNYDRYAYTNSFPGYMDSLRVTKRRRYAQSFTPPDSPLPNAKSLPVSSSSSSSALQDPHWQQVALLLHCDTDQPYGGGLLRDSSSHNTLVQVSRPGDDPDALTGYGRGMMKIMTDSGLQSPIGGGCLRLDPKTDGAGVPIWAIRADGGHLNAGQGDYTLEWYWYFTGVSYMGVGVVLGPLVFGTNLARIVVWNLMNGDQATPVLAAQYIEPGVSRNFVWAADISGIVNRWAHITISRTSGLTRVFIDGQQVTLGISPDAPFDVTAQVALDNSNLVFPSDGYNAQWGETVAMFFGDRAYKIAGYIDELRYTVGVGRRSENFEFTPPLLPYPNGGPGAT